MHRIILQGTNTEFPRAAGLNSGTQPESAADGVRHLVETQCPPCDAGSLPSARRQRGPSMLKALAAVALWDSGKFDTADIAHVMELDEADVVSVLHVLREERRARG